jgi:diguanylate cyclase (GGDEF)-like protein
MASTLGLRSGKTTYSPLAGSAEFRVQQTGTNLRQLRRNEWWLWFFAFLVTVLSAAAFALTANPAYFLRREHFYEIRSDQARWGILCLLLLFNGWQIYRQWTFRRLRKELSQDGTGNEAQPGLISDPSGFDPVTGLHTRPFIEQQLGIEIARAKRFGSTLSLATIHLDELKSTERYGISITNAALKELGRRLKKACRNSDFAVRLNNEDFLLVLPECSTSEVSTVLKRVGSLEMVCSGRRVNLEYSTGTVDYRAGDMPSDLLKRATEVLHLYENLAKNN